jgi:hypothetical protein
MSLGNFKVLACGRVVFDGIDFDSAGAPTVDSLDNVSEEDKKSLSNLKSKANEKPNVKGRTYSYLPSESIIKSVGDWLSSEGHSFDVRVLTGAADKSTKHVVEFSLRSLELFRDEGGGFGRVLIMNSYNAECSLTVLVGALRGCAGNRLVLDERDFSERIVHRNGGADQKLGLLNKKVSAAIEHIKGSFSAKPEQMSKQSLDFVRECQLVLGLSIPNVAKLAVIERLHPANRASLREQDRCQNLWSLYNLVNEAVREAARHGLSELEYNLSLLGDLCEGHRKAA